MKSPLITFFETTPPEPLYPPQDGKESLLLIKSAGQWLAEGAAMPSQKQLFGTFWHLGELSVLFGETGAAKSILAVQIADALTKGTSVLGMNNESPPVPVLYFDFELSTRQLYNRYSDGFGMYRFEPSLLRVSINPDAAPENFESELLTAVEKSAAETGAKVLIIDNLTFFSDELEKARNALPFIKALKAIKERYELSILILGHCPKRDSSRPVTGNDLAGSRNLLNFVDSAFAIGFSAAAPNRRYLKQIKVRACGIDYGANNVVVADIGKRGGMTQFEFVEFETEREHLTTEESWSTPQPKQATIDPDALFAGHDTLTTAEICSKLSELSVSERTAKRWIQNAATENIIVKAKHGAYSLAKDNGAQSDETPALSSADDENYNEWLYDDDNDGQLFKDYDNTTDDSFPIGLAD